MTKTAAKLNAEIAAALGTPKRPRKAAVYGPISPGDLCTYCGKPTRAGSVRVDALETAHKSCIKEFES